MSRKTGCSDPAEEQAGWQQGHCPPRHRDPQDQNTATSNAQELVVPSCELWDLPCC